MAKHLAEAPRDVLLLEQHPHCGMESSSRNSEGTHSPAFVPPNPRSHMRPSAVIHGGLYYEPDSLKARLCVAGRDALYAYAQQRGIQHRRLGKLIVATRDAQLPALRALAARGAANGVGDLQMLSAAGCRTLEPAVHAIAGLLSPSSGIIDSHGLVAALEGDIQTVRGWVSVTQAAICATSLLTPVAPTGGRRAVQQLAPGGRRAQRRGVGAVR